MKPDPQSTCMMAKIKGSRGRYLPPLPEARCIDTAPRSIPSQPRQVTRLAWGEGGRAGGAEEAAA